MIMSTFTEKEFSTLLSYAESTHDRYFIEHRDHAEWSGDFLDLFEAIAEGFERMDERAAANAAGAKLYRGYAAKARAIRDYHLRRIAEAKAMAEKTITAKAS